IFCIGESVGMFMIRLHLKQVYYVYYTDLQVRHFVTEIGYRSHSFQCRSIAAAGHYQIRLFSAVTAGPLPDSDTLGTVFYSLFHGQPLAAWMFGSHNSVYIVFALDTVIKAGEEAVSIRREIHADNICFLVGNVI